MKRIDPWRLLLERDGPMHQSAMIYASDAIQIEADAVRQLRNATLLDLDAIVVATPDIHTGFGVPIGCVFASPNLISPCAVGYDINCGMRLLATPLQRHEVDVVTLANAFRRDIPLGEGKRNIGVPPTVFDQVLEQGVGATPAIAEHQARVAACFEPAEFARDMDCIEDRGSMSGVLEAVSVRARSRGIEQLATLGGGNHFIEIQQVSDVMDTAIAAAFGLRLEQIVVMIHSGSRGLGYQVADEFMAAARRWDERHGYALPDRDLAYFTVASREGVQYRGAMQAAANFAFVNRQLMAMLVRRNLRHYFGRDLPVPTVYDVPHNIAKFEQHNGRLYCVHRKGATRAFPAARMQGTPYATSGQPVLIPGSMGTASYVLAGVDSGGESLYSVNHGAGRTMSRTAATGRGRRGRYKGEPAISDEAFKRSMEGVYLVCEDKRTVKEEAPAAYKDIDAVVAVVAGAGLARPVARMRPLAVLKG